MVNRIECALVVYTSNLGSWPIFKEKNVFSDNIEIKGHLSVLKGSTLL